MGVWRKLHSSSAFTNRQVLTVVAFSLSYFFAACVASLQALLYPAEAEAKGAVGTEYGLIFGVYQLVCFCASPIFGKYMSQMGAKRVFNVGVLTSGCSCFLFGFLDMVDNRFWFIFLSFLIRIVEAIGSTAYVTGAFSIIADEFSDSVATTFAFFQTMYGVGSIIGPAFGSVLYKVGGFVLPFAFIGASLASVTVATIWLLPEGKTTNANSERNKNERKGYGILQILKLPAVQFCALNIWMGANSTGFLSTTLEPHLRQFKFDVFENGLIFMLMGGAFAISAPLWGKVIDKGFHPKFVMLFGSVLNILAFMIIGPAPFLPFNTYFPLVCIGLVLQGLGVAACQVSSFSLALRECIENGFPDDLNLYSVVSGMWASFLALGSFTGPSIGGILWDVVGYRLGSLYPLTSSVIVLVLSVAFIIFHRRNVGSHIIDIGNESHSKSQSLLFGLPSRDLEAEPRSKITCNIPRDYGTNHYER